MSHAELPVVVRSTTEWNAQRSPLLNAGSSTPAWWTNLPPLFEAFGYECRLVPGPAEVEISVLLTPRSVAGVPSVGSLPEEWQPIRDWLRRWAAPDGAARAPFTILEFDGGKQAPVPPVPALFVSIQPLPEVTGVTAGEHIQQAAWTTDVLLPYATTPGSHAATAVGVTRAFEALPEGASVLHVGLMLSRKTDMIRLFVACPGERVSSYLEALGCPELARSLHSLLDDFGRWDAKTHFQIDVGAAIGPRISIEYALGDKPPEQTFELTQRTLAALVRHGLCCPVKARALLQWPARYRIEAEGSAWDVSNRVSHIKVADMGGRREAKAYVYCVPVSVGSDAMLAGAAMVA